MRSLLGESVFPLEAQSGHRGSAVWRERGLEYIAWLEERPDGSLGCCMTVGDGAHAELMREYGRMSVLLRSRQAGLPRPTGQTLTDDEVGYFRYHFGLERAFVADRHDLCRLFTAESDVVRGEVVAWLPASSRPARLVQALILAEDLGDEETSASIRRRIHESDDAGPSRANTVYLARQWAAMYSAAIGRPVNL